MRQLRRATVQYLLSFGQGTVRIVGTSGWGHYPGAVFETSAYGGGGGGGGGGVFCLPKGGGGGVSVVFRCHLLSS